MALEEITINSGQTILAHAKKDCSHPCPLHAPSSHHMITWKLLWRDDEGIFERICPHGIGHPDPDVLAFLRNKLGDEEVFLGEVHSCDGCCRSI